MKKSTLLFALFFSAFSVFGQLSIDSSMVVTLDRYDQKFRNFWSSDMESVRMLFLEKTTGAKKETVMRIEIESKQWETTGMSSGSAYGSRGGWAVGISTQETLTKNTGIIEFSKLDFERFYSKANAFLKLTYAPTPEFETKWSFEMGDRLVYSLHFQPQNAEKWAYSISLDGASFEIPNSESLPMLKKLSSFSKLFSKGN